MPASDPHTLYGGELLGTGYRGETHSEMHGRVLGMPENVQAWGAVGDGVTDDYAAIQACINSGAADVYFPQVASHYAIGTPLVPHGGQNYIGDGGTASGYGQPASRLKCKGSNTVLWEGESLDIGPCRWQGLVFEDKVTSSGVDTIFHTDNNHYFGLCDWTDCVFAYAEWAFHLGTTGWFLSNNFARCIFFNSASHLVGDPYINNNHWVQCQFQGHTRDVPVVEIDAGAAPSGNYFTDCYFETAKRQAVKITNPNGFAVNSTYVEQINTDLETYTTKDAKTKLLPAFDICTKDPTNLYKTSTASFDNVHFTVGNLGQVFGSSEFGTGMGGTISFRNCNGISYQTPAFTGIATVAWDTSAHRYSLGHVVPVADFNTIGIFPNNFTASTMPTHDAKWSDLWFMEPVTSTNFTIPNPTNPNDGDEITYMFYNNGGNLGTVTWGSQYVFRGASTLPKPASGLRNSVTFRFYASVTAGTYDASTGHWVEVARSDASAANADTSGAILADLETEVNQLKAALRLQGLLAT